MIIVAFLFSAEAFGEKIEILPTAENINSLKILNDADVDGNDENGITK